MNKNWQKTDKKRNQQIIKMRKEGKSYRVLGRIFHISHTRVKIIIDKERTETT